MNPNDKGFKKLMAELRAAIQRDKDLEAAHSNVVSLNLYRRRKADK